MITADLLINTLLRFKEDTEKFRIERVLKVDIPEEEIITIDISDPKAMLKKVRSPWLEELFLANEVEISDDDPFLQFIKPEVEIPEKYRKHRDAAWEVIKDLVEHPHILDAKARGPLIVATVADLRKNGQTVTKASVYKYLRRYWQGGQTPSALLPYWHRSGTNNQPRNAGTKKRGRPRVYGSEVGVNVYEDSEAMKQLLQGYDYYIAKRNAITFQDAYDGTITNYFADIAEAEHPTKAQFIHWMHKKVDPEILAKFHLGERGYNKDGRPLSGKATDISIGPGSPFMIDETPGDIRLVSKITRKDIGRANIIFIIDVYSWLIAGVSVTLEAPSWMTAVAALENTVTDKVEYCRQFGIEISEAQWPAHHLPKWIYADRGVFKSYNSDNLTGHPLKITVSNNPPGRPDLKGMIERTHRLLKDFLVKELPGAILKEQDKRFEINATVDIDQLREVVIRYILHHNENFRLRKFAVSEAIVADRIKPCPIDLWNWGRKNVLGHLRPMKPEVLRANLLPSAKAKVTEAGIRYRNLYFTCETFRKEKWALKAKRSGVWEITIRYHPNTTKEIYFRPHKNAPLETCTLLERDHAFFDADWKDVDEYFKFLGEDKRNAEKLRRMSMHKLKKATKETIKKARKLNKEAKGASSKNAAKGELVEERKSERERDSNEAILKMYPDDPAKAKMPSNVPLNEVESEHEIIPETSQSTLEALLEATEEFHGGGDA